MDASKQRYKEFGDFLKTRRAKILPAQVGLPEGIRRRTPGLRREEVASLSGVGLTWYTWIEQGRPVQVSSQVVEILARTLMLDNQETIHLYNLAGQTPPPASSCCADGVDPMLQHMMDSLEFSPAMILDARWNVIAWNRIYELLLDLNKTDIHNLNVMRLMFTDEDFQKTFPDWESSAQGMIARFRAVCVKFANDPWLEGFVGELKSASGEFDLWWSMHNVKPETERFNTVIHPALGRLDFEETSFMVADGGGLKMSVFTPREGTDTKERIKQFLARIDA
jgi:transcriptional regulator with XRE-family HTH domain